MDDITVAKPESAQEGQAQADDRRRAGRVKYTNRALIALLRTPSGAAAPPSDLDTSPAEPTTARDAAAAGEPTFDSADDNEVDLNQDLDPLGGARGIANGVWLSCGCWVIIGAALWLMLRS
jgi:hypothetical protein